MAKVIIEYTTKTPKGKLTIFVDEAKIGQVRRHKPLEIDVPAGNHLLHVGFDSKKGEGVGVPFQVIEGAAKKIKTSLNWPALFAAKRPELWGLLAGFLTSFSLGFIVAVDQAPVPSYNIYFSGFMLGVLVSLVLKGRQKKNPKNFVEIKVLE